MGPASPREAAAREGHAVTGTHAPIEERLWRRVDATGDCWLWTGSTTKAGYGQIVDKPFVGMHLEVVTPGENTRRGFAPAIRSHRLGVCRRGHPFTDDNVYRGSWGQRCRTCVLASRRRRQDLSERPRFAAVTGVQEALL